MYEYIKENLKSIRQRIFESAQKSGRNPDEITLVAVSKTHPPEAITAAVDYGVTVLGESRVQEAESKIEKLGKIAKWHMIGHLQTNKVKKAVELFDLIESVDSLRLAEEINKRTARKINCLLEVNSSGESSKSGVLPAETLEMIEKIAPMENINLAGLMTIGPLTDNMEQVRDSFRKTFKLFQKGQQIVGESFNTLSMGMSDDFEIAIGEGSTMVRVGTAIFGPREY